MDKKSILDIDVKDKKVIVRVDYNVPVENGVITDDTRMTKSLPTLQYLLDNGAAVILMAHFGRPKGKEEKYSLRLVSEHLKTLLDKDVIFVDDCIGQEAQRQAKDLKKCQVMLLENLRFYKEEEANDHEFAQKLASLADVYVNDGFGVSHRAHASVEAITHYLPSVAGFLLEKEITFLGKTLEKPVRPLVAILGGAKVSDKINVIASFLTKVDKILVGGGMANTFLAAQGYNMQASLIEQDKVEYAKKLLEQAKQSGVEFLLPIDVVAAEKFAQDAQHENCSVDKIKQGWTALDIGEKTCKLFSDALKDAKTVIWNGPMGVFEMDAFCIGTEKIAKAIAATDAISVVGGGDSVAAIEKLGLVDEITHISTGGGASLEYMEGQVLPGISSLDDLRQVMIAGNWKMHKTVPESIELANEIVQLTFGTTAEVAIFPPYTALESVAQAIDGKHVGYGSQDLHYEDQGAFTGAISGKMIADIGCEYSLVGHSERRHVFGETDEVIAKKVKAAFKNGLKPILCVGETQTERDAGQTKVVIERQLKTAFFDLKEADVLDMLIAYEPVWAIGTGNTASADDAQEVCSDIRLWLERNIGQKAAKLIRVLYGGSVNSNNIKELMSQDDIDGALVGGASLDAEHFAKIVRY